MTNTMVTTATQEAAPQLPLHTPTSTTTTTTCPSTELVHVHDAKAAHFLRHEVKNGVLAAMGIVESLQEAYRKLQQQQSPEQSPEHQEQPIGTQLNDLNKTLGDLLSRTLDQAMTLEVVHGDYGPLLQSVDLVDLLKNQDTSRFPLLVEAEDFPHLMVDPNLLRAIHSHAVSNACKFGQEGGVIQTRLAYNQDAQVFTLQVENAPGPGHEQLVQLSTQQRAAIFQEDTKLPCNNVQEEIVKNGSGAGAFFLQNCAQAMGGTASIAFEPQRTVLTVTCPARVSPMWLSRQLQVSASAKKSSISSCTQEVPMDICLSSSQTNKAKAPTTTTSTMDVAVVEAPFQIPENTWCIVVEDSTVQRKMLQRYLSKAGVKPERCLLLGQTNTEIVEFVQRAKQLILQHQNDKVLIIMDENLDLVEGGTVTKTISGSYCVQQLCNSLEPSDEARVLALVRSANDSLYEQRLYQERAHGFIPKGPIKHGDLLQAIQPWWKKRFAATATATVTAPKPQVPAAQTAQAQTEPPKKKPRKVAISFSSNALTFHSHHQRAKTTLSSSSSSSANKRNNPLRHSNSSPTVMTGPSSLERSLSYQLNYANNHGRFCNYFFNKKQNSKNLKRPACNLNWNNWATNHHTPATAVLKY